jgi:hypothetical protein
VVVRKTLEEKLEGFPRTYPLAEYYGRSRCSLGKDDEGYCVIAAHVFSGVIPELDVVAGEYVSGSWGHVWNVDADRKLCLDGAHDRFPMSASLVVNGLYFLHRKNNILRESRLDTRHFRKFKPRIVDELVEMVRSQLLMVESQVDSPVDVI